MSNRCSLKIVIIGGVAAGASAAAKARRTDEHAEIVLLEKGQYVSFANCGLPFHISGEIVTRDDLFVVTPERLNQRHKIDVRSEHEATRVDRKKKQVDVRALSSGDTYCEAYDKLVIATGAVPVVPDIPGIDTDGVFCLKTISDMDRIIAYRERRRPNKAVVVGGGFIGLEAAEALYTIGMEVTVVEAANQLLGPWDADMASAVEQHLLERLCIEVIKSDAPAEVLVEDGRVAAVRLRSGQILDTELVILAIGVVPASQLAAEAGLQMSPRGLILTDDHMRTSDQHIFAAGDAVQAIHRVTGEPTWLPLAGPANRQGRVAGANAAGGDALFPGVLGTAIVRVGRIVAARTGLSALEARAAGFDFLSTRMSAPSNARYYPGADDVDIKLISQKQSGRLLGAQVLGRSGVDKRIDVLATAVTAKMSVRQLVDLELAYAPPFGAAKDPINLAAMVAENRMTGATDLTTWADVADEDPAPLIIDVRSEEERRTFYIKNSEHIALEALREKLAGLDPDTSIRIYCRVGYRGYLAERILRGHGFKDVKNIAGGLRAIAGELREERLVGEEPEPEW